MTLIYHLAEHVVCRKTNTELRMLFDRQKGVMYELNESASAVVEQLEREPSSLETLTSALLDDFDAPTTEVQADIEQMLADFADAGLVLAQ